MFEITHRCGYCDELVDFPVKHLENFTVLDPADVILAHSSEHQSLAEKLRRLTDETGQRAAALTGCPRCAQPSMIVFNASPQTVEGIKQVIAGGAGGILGGQSNLSNIMVHPPAVDAEKDPDWPDELAAQFADAQRILSQNMSPSIVLTTCRTVLEIALTRLGAEGETLAGKIRDVRDRGAITGGIADWATEVRIDGNAAAHEGVGDKEAAAEYVEFLRVFLNVAFALPARIEAKKAQVAD